MERSQHLHHFAVYAIDFDDGSVVWETEVHAEVPTFDRHLKNTYASATPVTDGERVYADYIVWYDATAGPYHPTPLVYGDYYFTLLDFGFFTVHDALTGEELYFTEQQIQNKQVRQRVARGSGGFTASPWAYNGKIFVLSEDGDTYVIDTANEFRVVATNSLPEVAMSSPAIASGSLFIRDTIASVAAHRHVPGRQCTVRGTVVWTAHGSR